MFNNLKPKPLALDVLQLGHKAISSTKFPERSCVIRSFKGHHHDVFISKGRRGGFKVRFYDTLIGQTIYVDSVKSLNDLKLYLDKQ